MFKKSSEVREVESEKGAIAGFSTEFIVPNKAFGQWAVLIMKSEKYFVLATLTARWYVLRVSFSIS